MQYHIPLVRILSSSSVFIIYILQNCFNSSVNCISLSISCLLCEGVINVWNNLHVEVDFISITMFKCSMDKVDFNGFLK